MSTSDFIDVSMTLTYKINTETSQTFIDSINCYTKGERDGRRDGMWKKRRGEGWREKLKV